ncbi:MAG: hypothetical protein U5M50_10670 [Sphingobium sp.]|nr:hypothetical protein [Sphingobium sp.]
MTVDAVIMRNSLNSRRGDSGQGVLSVDRRAWKRIGSHPEMVPENAHPVRRNPASLATYRPSTYGRIAMTTLAPFFLKALLGCRMPGNAQRARSSAALRRKKITGLVTAKLPG